MNSVGLALRCAAAAVTVILAAGCAITTGGGTAAPSTNPLDTIDQSAMADDEQTAVKATNAFWQRHFSEFAGRPYRSPRVAGGYLGSNGPRCAGAASVPFNAFYCPAGDFLAWDENLMAAGYKQIGDAWVYLIIAHEWGHAIQARLDRGSVSVAAELQADCLAGATLQGAAQDGLVQIEPGDSEEIGQTLVAVADDFPWTRQSDHGDAEQRVNAFNTGARGGVAACT
jgi:hypothetical protein